MLAQKSIQVLEEEGLIARRSIQVFEEEIVHLKQLLASSESKNETLTLTIKKHDSDLLQLREAKISLQKSLGAL